MKKVWVEVKELTDNELQILIAQEASEVAKAATKILMFGLWSSIKKIALKRTDATENHNWLDLKIEFFDLCKRANDSSFETRMFDAYKKERLVLR